jgi:copper resistance protein B
MRGHWHGWIAAALVLLSAPPLQAEDVGHGDDRSPYGMAMHDDRPIFHLLLEEFEYRAGGDGAFAWDGQAWYGSDAHRLWLKSEGEIAGGRFEHGQHEILYDRPILPYFDLQAGLRADIDDNPGRGWFAFGVQGLAPNFFEVSATAYVGGNGRFAANAEASFDLLLTQRLILQPKAEINLYAKNDPARGIASGFTTFESGLRLRYEITRKFAPYIGLNYDRKFGATKRLAVANGEDAEAVWLVFGIHAWI